MESIEENNERSRFRNLHEILLHQRNLMLARVREWRHDQEDETLAVPSDELDIARSQADVEMHASLIERSEDLLKAIDGAFARLQAGTYGVCEGCGTEIPLERLKTLPFALYCVDCQQKTERGRERGMISESFMRHWEIPEEMDESLERQDSLAEPEDQLIVHRAHPFGPEEGEFAERPTPPARGRAGRGARGRRVARKRVAAAGNRHRH